MSQQRRRKKLSYRFYLFEEILFVENIAEPQQ